VDVKVQ